MPAGARWLKKEYAALADSRAYKDVAVKPRDPFDNLYATIANDLLAARKALTSEQRAQIHEVVEPAVRRRSRALCVPDLPCARRAQGYIRDQAAACRRRSRSSQRMDRIHERDYALVDTLNEHYTNFSESMDDAYSNWRKYSNEELRRRGRREAQGAHAPGARRRCRRGWRARGPGKSAAAPAIAAATAAVIGGIYAFKSGLDMRSEIKMHGESLKQLGSSFQNEVQPIVVDIEGRTLELKGSAEQQYAEWRQSAARTV